MPEVRPIDANALSKQIKNLQRDFKKSPAKQYVIKILLSMLNDRIQTPTLNYDAVVHAHWGFADGRKKEDKRMIANHFIYKCSNCGKFEEIQTKFCCSCGAKMDEDVK